MISDLKSIQHGFGPPPPSMAAANTAANHPDTESIHLLAKKMASDPHLGGFRPASPPGLGGSLDLYDSAGIQAKGFLGGKRPDSMRDMMKGKGDYAQGLSTSEPLGAPPDFPYLKPLSGPNLGKKLNTLI